MDIRQLLQDCMLVIFLIHFHHIQSVRLLMEDEDYEDGPSFGRCPWIRNKLKNGRVRYRYKGRVAKFLCDSGYELAGKRSSTCVKGQWSNPLPVCVARGCNRVPSIANGRVTEMYRGALLVYDCNPGYTLVGDASIHCDGRRWSSGPPECTVASESPELSCDFENPDMCGWSHDPNHDFDWKRNQFSTPSGHAGTGPSFDHTFGESRGGYYLFIEASSPRKINDTARLFSPVYFDSMSGGCFLFWYHMYGATTGGLRVYLKPESHVFDELTPAWEKYGDQGNQWVSGNLAIPHLHENFQIVIEGVRGESYVGDSGIDDVLLTVNDCDSMENNTETIERTISNSCRGRCREADSEANCGCNDNCYTHNNCCHDYTTLCYQGNDTAVPNTDELVPGDYYGKTSSTVTVPATATMVSDYTNTISPTVSSVQTSKSTKSSTVSAPSTVLTTLPSTTVSTSGTIEASLTEKPTTSTTSAPTTKSSTTFSSTSSPYTPTIPSTSVKTTRTTTLATTPTQSPSSTSPPKPTTISTIAVGTSSSTTSKPTTSSTTPVTSTTTSTTLQTTTTTTPASTQATATSASTQATTTSTITSSTSTTEMSTSTIRSTSPSPQTMSSILSILTTTVPDTTTESTSSSPNVPDTTTSSTRKTYNLRPRTQRTTPFSSTSVKSVTTVSSNTPMREQRTSRNYEATISTSDLTSWHNPVSQPSTLTSTEYSVTSTAMLTTKMTRSTSAVKRYTTTSTSTTTLGQPRKFTFRFTTSSTTPPPSTLDTYHMGTSKVESLSNGSTSIVVSLVVIVVICIAGGVVYYRRKRKNQRQSKLSDDSEMRFLQENDYTEYSDASALDKILIK